MPFRSGSIGVNRVLAEVVLDLLGDFGEFLGKSRLAIQGARK